MPLMVNPRPFMRAVQTHQDARMRQAEETLVTADQGHQTPTSGDSVNGVLARPERLNNARERVLALLADVEEHGLAAARANEAIGAMIVTDVGSVVPAPLYGLTVSRVRQFVEHSRAVLALRALPPT